MEPWVSALHCTNGVSNTQSDADALREIVGVCKYAIDHAPSRPNYTCQDIDKAIRFLNKIAGEINVATGTLQENELDNPFPYRFPDADVDSVVYILEDLRKDNAMLRDNGTHFYDVVKQLWEIADDALANKESA